MDIHIIGSQKIKVVLSPEDMKRMELTYETLDHDNPKVRLCVLQVLREAKLLTGFQFQDPRILIEAFPDPEKPEGCILYISSISDREKDSDLSFEEVSPVEPVVFRFEDLEVLIDAASKLFSQYCHRIYKSSLCRVQEDYFLIIYPLDQAESVTVHFLQEYGELAGKGELYFAVIKEHGRLLIENNALETISRYFY